VGEGKLIRFNPAETAIKRTKVTTPVKIAHEKGFVSFRGKLVLDYGVGHSIDYTLITKFGGTCYLYDITWFPLSQSSMPFFLNHSVRPITPHTPNCLFDVILLNYVLNVVTLAERNIIAETAVRLLQPTGKILVGVREDEDAIKLDWLKFEDGFITPKKTFQSFFNKNSNGLQKLKQLFPKMKLQKIGRGIWVIFKNANSPKPRYVENSPKPKKLSYMCD
jgi:hypothetical protein